MGNNKIGAMRVAFDYTDTSSFAIGQLPANAIVNDIKVHVSTPFNAGTNDYLDIGTADTAAKYANDVDLAGTGSRSVTLIGTGSVESATAPTTLYGIYVPSGSTPTEGAGEIVITYVYKED